MWRGHGWLGVIFPISVIAAACSSPTELPDGVVAAPLDASIEVIAEGFGQPWAIAVLNEDEFLVSERAGGLRYVANGQVTNLEDGPQSQVFDARGTIVGGLMDVSLHPNFVDNGLVYLTYLNQDDVLEIGRFDFSERTINNFEVIFTTNARSIGSRIAWEDNETFLFTHGTTLTELPDDLESDGGKTHRLTADGSVPADNPIFDGQDSPSSIWTYGHRVSQGIVVVDGTVYSHEHGDAGGDEFNIIEPGNNYGWPAFSFGTADDPLVNTLTEAEAARVGTLPTQHWGDFTIAPSSLRFVRDSAFPELDGQFLIGSLTQASLLSVDIDSGLTSILLDDVGRVRDVAVLPSGSIVVAIENIPAREFAGSLIRLSPPG